MRKKTFLLIIMIFTSLAFFVCPSAAQDIDLSGMDNAQLMQLLQTIMQKLEEETADKSPEAAVVTIVPAIKDIRESVAGAKHFRIYDNKKLIPERIPDSFFIRNDPTEEPPAEGNPDKETPPAGPQDNNPCIICYMIDLEDGSGWDCFSIC